MSFVPGTIFKHYRIEGLIGKGGMGEVYLAEETTLGRKVAIKMLTQETTRDPKFVQRFRNEAHMLGRLYHPGIVALHTFLEDGGAYYLVMQYAPGITLAELIRRTGPIPEQRALHIVSQIGEALSFAHSEGIVHRDIKPSNIMIDPDKNDRVLVMDFGIARMIDAQHITRTGTQMGTPCYMSPEQVLGKKEIGPPSDIYSAGVLLHEMLSGTLPYDLDTESLYTIQDRILKEPLPDPRLCYEYISERSVALVKDLTQKEADKRPQSIAEALQNRFGEQAVSVLYPVVDVPEKKQETMVQRDLPVIQEKPAPSYEVSGDVKPRRKWVKHTVVIGIVVFAAIMVLLASLNAPKALAYFEDVPVEAVAVDEAIAPVGMISVEGGTFMMGSNDGDSDEKPVHQVTVSSFMIGKYEVTQKEWREVMGSNPSYFTGDDLSVEGISWYDAVDYCNKRSIKEGLTPCYSGSGNSITCNWNANGYRLPTEAEWEFAARGGIKSKDYTYSGSDNIANVASYGEAEGQTHTVDTKAPNELGIYDMSGNVWEWCWDWYDARYYVASLNPDPKGAGAGSERVLRGGSWAMDGFVCRVADRHSNKPDYRGSIRGLRVFRAIK